MNRIGFRRPSPPMVVALVALLAALAGTSYAAVQLPANSVGTKQLKKNAVTGKKVKNHSLKAVDFAAKSLPAGPRGAQGAQGPQGLQGPKGEKGEKGDPAPAPIITAREGVPTSGDADVFCEPNEVALGGGGTPDVGGYLTDSEPDAFDGETPTGWFASAADVNGDPVDVTAWVICGAAG